MDCVVARALRRGTLDQAGAGREGMRLSAIRELGKFSRGRWAARGRGSLMTPRTRLAIALRSAQHFEATLGGRFI
jgi:hypothetical protein